MRETTLDGPSLEKALAENKFDTPAPILIGMVKASASQGHIAFAPNGCHSWIDLPTAMIAEAEKLGDLPCKDHTHPLFRLLLKEPKDPQAKALMALLSASAPAFSFGPMPQGPGQSARMNVAPGGAGGASRIGQCTSWCSGSTLICACPVYIPGLGYGYVFYACGTCINDPVHSGGVFTAFA